MKQIVFGLFATTFLFGCSKETENTKPTYKPIIEAVYASGFVVAKNQYEVIAQVEGYVSEKLVEDGDLVKRGDPLYIIDSDQQTARNRIAKETYALAQKNYRDNSPVLEELKAAMEVSKTRMLYDSTNFVRYENLIKSNAASRADYDRMKLAYENSRNEYLLQKSRYEKTRNQLQLEFESAKSNLVIASSESGRYVIKSEVDGKVFQTSKEKGELIRRSEVVAIVGQNDAYYLELNVDELDIHRIKAGQDVLVKIDAYPNKVFKAEITKVYPMVDRRQQAVRADASLKDELPASFSGLALEANIIINQKEKALVIPKASVLPGDSVMIETDDGTKKVKVTKGIETLDEVEIIEGLDTGNLIVLNRQ